jgi:hypothetical protein
MTGQCIEDPENYPNRDRPLLEAATGCVFENDCSDGSAPATREKPWPRTCSRERGRVLLGYGRAARDDRRGIVVGVDGSQFEERTLEFAAHEAAR